MKPLFTSYFCPRDCDRGGPTLELAPVTALAEPTRRCPFCNSADTARYHMNFYTYYPYFHCIDCGRVFQ